MSEHYKSLTDIITTIDNLAVAPAGAAYYGAYYDALIKIRNAIAALPDADVRTVNRREWRMAGYVKPDVGGRWVIGVATGRINGVMHRNAIIMVCYDKESDEWYVPDNPSDKVVVSYWMPCPEQPEDFESGAQYVRPVVKGKWLPEYPTTHVCSNCRYVVGDYKLSSYKYCPSCGADMRGDEEC